MNLKIQAIVAKERKLKISDGAIKAAHLEKKKYKQVFLRSGRELGLYSKREQHTSLLLVSCLDDAVAWSEKPIACFRQIDH